MAHLQPTTSVRALVTVLTSGCYISWVVHGVAILKTAIRDPLQYWEAQLIILKHLNFLEYYRVTMK